MSEEMVFSVIRNPTARIMDPLTVEKGYPVYQFRRGDITVVCGFKDPSNPHVFFMYVHSMDETSKVNTNAGTAKGPGSGSKVPKSIQQLKGWLMAQGCNLVNASNGGITKVYYHGAFVMNLHSTVHTQGGANIANKFSDAKRKMAIFKAMESLKNSATKEEEPE